MPAVTKWQGRLSKVTPSMRMKAATYRTTGQGTIFVTAVTEQNLKAKKA